MINVIQLVEIKLYLNIPTVRLNELANISLIFVVGEVSIFSGL